MTPSDTPGAPGAPEEDLRARLRAAARAYRASLAPEERARRSCVIAAHAAALPEFVAARSVMVYLDRPPEVETRPLWERARAAGKRLAAPRVEPDGGRMRPYWLAFDARGEPVTVTGTFSIREPDPSVSEEAPPEALDLILVPGLAFDPRGHRLGYGKGYYDRFLSAYPPGRRPATVALAFSGQVFERVPAHPWDVPVDWLVTEEGAVDCRGVRSRRR
ncbi:MAG: 5-formyltetrahydrofolate cyclo-ligase [Firmicutes bacterium]|nr:5-formyltetrahydrofolate cyclo-ligase [Bacillota bacterium]